MLDAVVELNARLAAEDPGAPQLAVGIGINSGPCCVGNLGSEMRFDYSVLGDTVNIAARLEGLTKAYGVPLLAGDDTRALAPHLPWLAIDEVAVRGRAAPVRMHALWTGDDIGSLADLHDALLGALGRGDGQRAAALLAEARSLAGESLAEAHRRLGERLGASAQASGQ